MILGNGGHFNPNSEVRNPRSERNPKPEARKAAFQRVFGEHFFHRKNGGGFGLRNSGFFRLSGIRISGLTIRGATQAQGRSAVVHCMVGAAWPLKFKQQFDWKVFRERRTADETQKACPPAKPRRQPQLSTHATAMTYAASFSGGHIVLQSTQILPCRADFPGPLERGVYATSRSRLSRRWNSSGASRVEDGEAA
jgi:hypothetical protein